MIKVEHLNKSFDKKKVLIDINASFERGKVNMIIGRSGSGKTVLLKSIIGLHTPDNGKVFFDNVDFTNSSIADKRTIRKELGMVFQGGALFTSSTIEDNILFPLDLFTNWSKAEKLKRVNFCLERVNIEGVNKLFPAEISGGMQKRVSIARAMVLNPKYLFCDEPNSGLDPQTAIIIDKLIREITYEYNITTIINTHDMNSVMEIGDDIYFIYEGKCVWNGNRDEIFETDQKELNEFVFASNLFKTVKEARNE